jgi:succinate dehydrogenase subunit C
VISGRHTYTEYHPRWLRQRVSTYWWLQRGSYFAFILREASCMFVGWLVVYLLVLINAVSRGPGPYARFLEWSATPWVLLLNIVSFLFMVYHAITFFVAAPQAMVVHVGRQRVPGHLVLAGHYAAWAVASAVVAWLVLRP